MLASFVFGLSILGRDNGMVSILMSYGDGACDLGRTGVIVLQLFRLYKASLNLTPKLL